MSKKVVINNWICLDCAKKRGARIPVGHLATFNLFKCDICKEIKEVTEPRDFGITRYLVEQ
jgi:hypothetical protein